jgi:preprotein translocase subunit SecB
MTANGSPQDPRPAGGTAPAGQDGPSLLVNGQYIKDLSFEVPNAPGIYGEIASKEPQITVNIEVKAGAVNDTLFEVALHISAECKAGELVAFVCELVYAGLFTLNVPREHLQAMLLIECPRMLFPFARNIIADATRDGAFPPLMLSPVDFVTMFRNQVAQQGQQPAADTPPA